MLLTLSRSQAPAAICCRGQLLSAEKGDNSLLSKKLSSSQVATAVIMTLAGYHDIVVGVPEEREPSGGWFLQLSALTSLFDGGYIT